MSPLSSAPKCYLAGPFFSPEQLKTITTLEAAILKQGWRMFSPRLGDAAQQMNEQIAKMKKDQKILEAAAFIVKETGFDIPHLHEMKAESPSADLRQRVFIDNYANIDDADLLVAVIDGFDTGTMWEIGYAYCAQVPIVTFTANNYGANLMLAQSIVGHVKDTKSLELVLTWGYNTLKLEKTMQAYGETIAMIQSHFKSEIALREGPDERSSR